MTFDSCMDLNGVSVARSNDVQSLAQTFPKTLENIGLRHSNALKFTHAYTICLLTALFISSHRKQHN